MPPTPQMEQLSQHQRLIRNFDRIAKTAFINNVCMLKASELWKKSAAADPFPHVTPAFEMTPEKGALFIHTYSYGASNAGNDMNKNLLVSKAACGSITLTDPKAKASYDEQAKSSGNHRCWGACIWLICHRI